MKYTYLLIDILAMLVPFLFSFHPKLKFYQCWNALFPAILLTAGFFVAFDIYFTHLKVWGFNPTYLTGFYISNLPFEELLFFICIPYSCLFTYHCLAEFLNNAISQKIAAIVNIVFVSGSLLLAILFFTHAYTLFAFGLLAILLFIAQYVLKVTWLGKFYLTYAILLLPFFIVNGLLTGTGLKAPVVWYNNMENVNLRILTIPVEDIFYGMALILLNLLLFSTFKIKFYDYKKAQQVIKRSSDLPSQIKS